MSGVIDLARRISECANPSPYTPMIGKIISLPELTIQIGSKILLYADEVDMTLDIYEKEYDGDGHFIRYKYLGKDAVILPYSKDNKFVVIGVLQ